MTQEIPVRISPTQNSESGNLPSSSADVQIPAISTQADDKHKRLQSSQDSAVTYDPIKEFLESCSAELVDFLPNFIGAGIKDESSLMVLILTPRPFRLSFFNQQFGNMMAPEQISILDDNCELQSQYAP
jgi:hypothetical protein